MSWVYLAGGINLRGNAAWLNRSMVSGLPLGRCHSMSEWVNANFMGQTVCAVRRIGDISEGQRRVQPLRGRWHVDV